MTRARLKNIIRGLTQAGSLFPHQMAFTLLIPLRALLLSPAELLRRLQPTADSRILEVGCGPGYFSPALARAVPQGELVLADIQPEMLAIARRRLEKRHITNTSCQLCNGSSFGRIVLVTVLGEVRDRSAYLREFARLLTHDGLLSISEAAGDPDKLEQGELIALLTAHGFTPVRQYGNRRNYTVNFAVADTKR
ncbi:class I SAM-dependent methyltransferase [Cardiobacterium hominis]